MPGVFYEKLQKFVKIGVSCFGHRFRLLEPMPYLDKIPIFYYIF